MINRPQEGRYDAVILAVAHQEFIRMSSQEVRALCRPEAIVYDVKHVLPTEAVDGSL